MIPTIDELVAGRTLAEIQGFTEELGAAVASLASREAGCGDLEVARGILEGLVVTNPRDALAWALLAQVERWRGEPATALLAAEAARSLDPEDPQVRLARAEVLLAVAEGNGEARHELEQLRGEGSEVGRRAASLLRALGS